MEKFVESIKVDISRIKFKGVLIHPYAHLSKSLGSPKLAKDFFNKLRDRLGSSTSSALLRTVPSITISA